MGKIFTVLMPDIGEGVMEGEIIQWLKNVGDSVSQDEPVVIVMTDKATVELPAPHPGKLAKQYYQAGGIAIRDKPLYAIEVADDVKISAEFAPISDLPEEIQKTEAEPKKISEAKALTTPANRKLAKELSLDIDTIKGTGPEGHITKEDIIKSYGLSKEKPTVTIQPLHLAGDHEEPITGIRNLMAKRMNESHRYIPQFSYFEQLDATRLVKLRNSFKEKGEQEGISVTYMPFIIKALSLTLLHFPVVNSSVDQAANSIIIHEQHNVGIAIASKDGLIVPVLKNVEKMTLQEIIHQYEALLAKVKQNKLLPQDMKESTITVSNFGGLGSGGQWATPIINYPEVAILGIGRIHKQPVISNDTIVIREVLNLSWGFDHRIIDGNLAAHFSHYLSTLLRDPAPLL